MWYTAEQGKENKAADLSSQFENLIGLLEKETLAYSLNEVNKAILLRLQCWCY
jgi:hypothetical protein